MSMGMAADRVRLRNTYRREDCLSLLIDTTEHQALGRPPYDEIRMYQEGQGKYPTHLSKRKQAFLLKKKIVFRKGSTFDLSLPASSALDARK